MFHKFSFKRFLHDESISSKMKRVNLTTRRDVVYRHYLLPKSTEKLAGLSLIRKVYKKVLSSMRSSKNGADSI